MSIRHVPVRYESDWWTRSHFPPPMSLMPSYNYSEPFPMENRWYHHDAPDRYANNDMRRMTEEMNKMMTTMQKSGPQAAPSVEDWRLTENFRLDNPVLQDRDGARKFHLQFDVRQFKPEEITVKTSGNQLSVHAKHDDKDSGRSTFREYSRQYMLPKEVNPELLISKLSSDGMLSIEAPLPALAGPRDKLIPIEHRK